MARAGKSNRFAWVAVLGALMLGWAWTAVPAGGGGGQGGHEEKGKGKDSNPGIWRPDSQPYGKSYGEWVAAFWQYALEFPLAGYPFLDTPAYDFAARQSGKVWFWSAPDGPLTRTVTIPEGKALFLTLRDVEVSSLEEPPFFGATEAEQREMSSWFADHIVDVFCTIDGVPVKDLGDYRFSSPQFEFTAPTPWIFGDEGGKGTSVGDGYYLMLKPLSRGLHVIHYGGTFHFEPGELDVVEVDLPKEITIRLIVGAEKEGHGRDGRKGSKD